MNETVNDMWVTKTKGSNTNLQMSASSFFTLDLKYLFEGLWQRCITESIDVKVPKFPVVASFQYSLAIRRTQW